MEPGFTRFMVAVESYLYFRDAITRVVLGMVSMGNFCSDDDALCGGGVVKLLDVVEAAQRLGVK
jgi:hypothetical protein